jgi:Domain of unknown function (DUF3846)
MSRAIFIDAEKREISEVECDTLKNGVRRLIGGYIEMAWLWPSGDVLFVDEEGLLKPNEHFFRLSLRQDGQPLAGSGVIVGEELLDREGEWIGNADPSISCDTVRPLIQFLSRVQAEAWGKANASNPFTTITTIRDGRPVTDVIRRAGTVFASIPRRK